MDTQQCWPTGKQCENPQHKKKKKKKQKKKNKKREKKKNKHNKKNKKKNNNNKKTKKKKQKKKKTKMMMMMMMRRIAWALTAFYGAMSRRRLNLINPAQRRTLQCFDTVCWVA